MRFALLHLCCLLLHPVGAQNLVPNWSFEEISSCPDDLGQVELADGWLIFRGASSCDLYHVCGHPDTAGVPMNWQGEQMPASGSGYSGVFTFSDDDGWPYYVREYMGIQLSSPLQIGTTYTATLKISATLSRGGQRMMFASNNAGLLFSTSYFFQNDLDPVPGYAHVVGTSVVEDTLGWTLISGSFIADSAYQFVVVGNFFSDEDTDWSLLDSAGIWNYAYYYVDDVCVSADLQFCQVQNGIVPHAVVPFHVWQQGAGEVLQAEGLLALEVDRIRVFDAIGRLVADVGVGGRDTWAMPTAELASGVYMVVAEHWNGSRSAERVFIGR